MSRTDRLRLLLLSLLLAAPALLSAQAPPSLAGDYDGKLGPLRLKLHFTSAENKLSCTLDSLDQGALGLPCANVKYDGKNLSFEVPVVKGSWSGTVSPDVATLTGNWSQGSPMPLEFKRAQAVEAAAKPSAVDGIWLGTLKPGTQELRIQLQLKSDAAGQEHCSLDSLDQGAIALECGNTTLNGTAFSFDVPAIHGRWSGTLTPDGNSLNGTWSQGAPLPLNFARQAKAIVPPPPAPARYDPAQPPATLENLQPLLDSDFAAALKTGPLAPGTESGIVIGVLQHGHRRLFTYGTAKPDSLFEIGSITKTFTGLILAQMSVQGKVKLDEPVRELLPPETVAKPAGGEITLLDLVTQHSGLPRMPDNFNPADRTNPYADYVPKNLYTFVAHHGVQKPAHVDFLYSNLGMGLLGQALADRASTNYPKLLATEVTGPLHLTDTVVTLSPDQQKRFLPGHDAHHAPAHAWDLDALAGAGAIRSTAADMLAYLEANLHPDSLPPGSAHSPAATLPAALRLSHELRADAFGSNMRIAFAWLYNTETESYWHNGATGGYSSYSLFNPKGDFAFVVLFNATIDPAHGSFADRVGEHLYQRLTGKPALSLVP